MGSKAKIYVNQIAAISLQLQNYMIGSVMVVQLHYFYKAMNYFIIKATKAASFISILSY